MNNYKDKNRCYGYQPESLFHQPEQYSTAIGYRAG